MGDDKHNDDQNLFDKLIAVLLRQSEQWETHVTHRTRCLKTNVIFKSRPPRSTTLIEHSRQRSQSLGKSAQVEFPDGRWLVA
jgi:hypothetical protein